jgi:hypothetical protein
LGDEKVRWQENVAMLDHSLANVIGDVLISAGFIAYLGPFTVSDQAAVLIERSSTSVHHF